MVSVASMLRKIAGDLTAYTVTNDPLYKMLENALSRLDQNAPDTALNYIGNYLQNAGNLPTRMEGYRKYPDLYKAFENIKKNIEEALRAGKTDVISMKNKLLEALSILKKSERQISHAAQNP